MTETAIALVPQAAPPARRQEVRVVLDPIPVLDTARFEHMQRVTQVMACMTMIPDALCKEKGKDETGKDCMIYLPEKQIMANCFMVVNQAVRWGMDPFAVAQCVSIVHGKLCYEGKLIAAVINAKLGFDLEYEITGEGDQMKVVVTAALDGKPIVDSKNQPKKVEGTVAEWQTTSSSSPWKSPGGKPRMLRYRGAREWCRVHSPALMLGVYSDDEMEVLSNDRRGYGARDVTPGSETAAIAAPRKAPPPPAAAETETQQVVESPTTAPEEIKPIEQENGAVGEASKSPLTEAPKSAATATRKAPPPPTQPKAAAEVEENLDIPDYLRGKTTATAETKKPAIPNAEQEPENFLRWAEVALSGAADADTFDAAKALVETSAKGLFPPDQEELDACFRRHEQRLAP